jgi:hypothetical protein
MRAARPPRGPFPGPNPVQANLGPTLALRKPAAAAALGISDETFDRYVRPHVPRVRVGTVTVYPVAELAAWLDDNASSPLDERDAAEDAGE